MKNENLSKIRNDYENKNYEFQEAYQGNEERRLIAFDTIKEMRVLQDFLVDLSGN